jgi:3-hydroxymyristoyl/3-hydroxydecanoyl-(acyl carrier protein) dehydratase
MTPQPDVRAVRRSGASVELELEIPRTLDFFEAHFPRFALLPGVVQLDWAIRYGRDHLRVGGDFRRLRGLKFLHPILPGARVVLTLSPGDPGEVRFAYRNAGRTYSTGCAVFGIAREP